MEDFGVERSQTGHVRWGHWELINMHDFTFDRTIMSA